MMGATTARPRAIVGASVPQALGGTESELGTRREPKAERQAPKAKKIKFSNFAHLSGGLLKFANCAKQLTAEFAAVLKPGRLGPWLLEVQQNTEKWNEAGNCSPRLLQKTSPALHGKPKLSNFVV